MSRVSSTSKLNKVKLGDHLTGQVGTSTYSAPELESNSNYNEKIDIYAMGIILLEMSCKFSTSHERGMVMRNLKRNRQLPASLIESSVGSLIIKMTAKDPRKRMDITELTASREYKAWAEDTA